MSNEITNNPLAGVQAHPGTDLLTDIDICLFKSGNPLRLFERVGSHFMTMGDIEGALFAARDMVVPEREERC